MASAKARSTCPSTPVSGPSYTPEWASRSLSEPVSQQSMPRPRAGCSTVHSYHQPLSNESTADSWMIHRTSRGSRSVVKCNNDQIEPIMEDGQTVSISSEPGIGKSSESSEEHALLPARRYNLALDKATFESPRRSMPAFLQNHDKPFGLPSPRRRSCTLSQQCDTVSAAQNGPSEVGTALEERLDHGHGVNDDVVSKSFPPATKSSSQVALEASEKTPLSLRFGRQQENRQSLPSELSSIEVDSTPSKKRALHRQVRMIDGALFHPRTRKGKFIESDTTRGNSPVKPVTEKPAKRLTLQLIPHVNSPRVSWLQNVINRFRSESHRKQQQQQPPSPPLKLRKRHSSLADCGMANICKHNTPATRHRAATATSEMKEVPSSTTCGFDGVNEHHNKPLPLSPADEGRTSLTSETQRSFFGRSTTLNPYLPKSSVLSPDHSDLASLVSATMTGPQELSPKEERWKHNSLSSSQTGPPS